MSIFKLSLKNIFSRPMSSVLSIMLLSLGVFIDINQHRSKRTNG